MVKWKKMNKKMAGLLLGVMMLFTASTTAFAYVDESAEASKVETTQTEQSTDKEEKKDEATNTNEVLPEDGTDKGTAFTTPGNGEVKDDITDDSTKEYYEKTAPEVTYAFCSFDGTDQEAEEHLKKIISMGPKLAMASRGARGCILYDGRNFYRQPAAPLTEVKDTLGAGDSLIASFLTGYIGRMKNGMAEETAICESLEEAAAFAAGICGMEGAFGYGKKYE